MTNLLKCYETNARGQKNVIGFVPLVTNLTPKEDGQLVDCGWVEGVGRTKSGKWYYCHAVWAEDDLAPNAIVSDEESYAVIISEEKARWLVLNRAPYDYAEIIGEAAPEL